MTVQIDGTQIGEIIEVAATVFSILLMIVCAWFVYLMVRPSRNARAQAREADPIGAEELRRLVDRMEARLDVLERALADQIERPAIGRRDDQLTSTPAESGRD